MSRAQELLERIEAIVTAMDPVTREVFLLHRVDGWPYPRIAHVLGINVAEVERQIADAGVRSIAGFVVTGARAADETAAGSGGEGA